MIPRHNVIFAVVPTDSRLRLALKFQDWRERRWSEVTCPDGRVITTNGYAVMSKAFNSNADIAVQLDRFAGQNVPAWAGR